MVGALRRTSTGIRRWRLGIVDAVLIVGVLAGFAFRVWVLSSSRLGSLDSDEAVWGLMARHMLHGHWSTFFWGQTYGGSQEAILTAGLFGVAGTGTFQLKFVPTVLYAVAALLVWRVGRRTVGEPAARLAAVLFWIWPAYFVWRSTKAFGYYGSALVLGLLVVLLALRLRARRSLPDAVALGLAAGMGWWATPQIVVLAAPAIVWLVWGRWRTAMHLWPAVPGFMVGALPWFVTNVREGWPSLHSSQARTSEAGHLHNLVTAVLPTGLGLRVPFSLDWIAHPAVGVALYGVALVGFAWLVWRRPPGLGLLLLICLLFPILYTISPYTYLSAEPRYIALLMPALVLLLAWPLCRPWWAAASVAAALALSIAGLVSMQDHRLTLMHAAEATIPPDTRPVIRLLERSGIRTAVADYWIAYAIDFESRERIIAVPAPSTGLNRHPSWRKLVRRDPRAAWVFVHGAAAERRSRPGLLRRGYRRLVTEGFDVYVRSAAAGASGAASFSG